MNQDGCVQVHQVSIEMNSRVRKSFSLFSSGSIAFVIVVCASFASATTAMIYARRPVPAWEIAVLIAGGAAAVHGPGNTLVLRRRTT